MSRVDVAAVQPAEAGAEPLAEPTVARALQLAGESDTTVVFGMIISGGGAGAA